MSSPAIDGRDPTLVREALDALLEIAWHGRPDEVVGALREQAQGLSSQERVHMLEGFVDHRLLAQRLEEAQRGHLEPAAAHPLEASQSQMVDAALEPLTQLVRPDALEALDDLAPAERAHLLFSAVHRQE